MKYLENFALNYSVELLFNENPVFENNSLLTQLKQNFKNVEILFSTKALISFVFNDFISELDGTKEPVQIIVIRENNTINTNKIKKSLTQTWDWKGATEIVDECRYSIVISDFMATNLNYDDRTVLFNKALNSVLNILPCKAINWSYSQKLVNPNEFCNALIDESYHSLYGLLNVRYFKIDDEQVMDTMGLSALGLPDLECSFKNLDKGSISSTLYDYAQKIFKNGDYLKDGEKIHDNTLNLDFFCHHKFSKTMPKRIVLELNFNF